MQSSFVLDLYAGTGALGLEALSRGAQNCVFVDNQKKALEVIKKNVQACGLDETALGCFVELEGDPASIDRWASELGYTPDRYVTASYIAMQGAAHPGEDRIPDLLVPADDAQ